MINPIAARIAFNTTSSKTATLVAQAVVIPSSNSDSFISSTNFGENKNPEVKQNKTLLEILFGNVSKNKKNHGSARALTSYEAKLYAKPKNEAELKEFFDSYEPMIKF